MIEMIVWCEMMYKFCIVVVDLVVIVGVNCGVVGVVWVCIYVDEDVVVVWCVVVDVVVEGLDGLLVCV